MAYFGPANKAKEYFIDMGYEPANRQTTADFLVATTDPLARIERPFHGTTSPIPRMAAEFVAHFKASPFAALNREDMASYHNEFVGRPKRADGYKASVRAEHSKHVWRTSAYMISIPMQVRAVMVRQVQIMYGNSMALLFTLL
jgi:ATP-binding cassette, subfamily G (WHITE), member 2, SNQ2